MATRKKATKKDKEKTVDLPPKGPRNTDPLSGAAGAHPIETGVGAALGGAGAGLAVGALGGPVGAVIGAAVGGARWRIGRQGRWRTDRSDHGGRLAARVFRLTQRATSRRDT